MISYETRIGKITLSNSYFSKLIGRAVTSCFGVVGMVPSGGKQRILDMFSKKSIYKYMNLFLPNKEIKPKKF